MLKESLCLQRIVPRRLTLTLVTVIACLGLSACMVGPDYVRPSIDVGTVFKETPGWLPANPMTEPSDDPWWTVYDDRALSDLMVRATDNNFSIVQAEAQYRQALALVDSATSGLFPTLGLNASVNRTGATATGQGGRTLSTAGSTFGATANASWELDLWGGIRRSIEASQASMQASAASLAGVRLSTQTTLALFYVQVRVLDGQSRLLADTVTAYERSLRLTQNRYAEGVARRGDVALATAQLETARAQMIDLVWRRGQLENAIAVLLGQTPASFSLPETSFQLQLPAIPVGVPSTLLERRPDVAAAERRTAAANAQIGVATSAWFPDLTISGNAGYRAAQFAQWFTAPAQVWAIGPALAQVLFDGGFRRAQIAQTRAAFDAQAAVYRLTVLRALQEVEDAMLQLRVLAQEQTVQRRAVDASKEALTLARNQYAEGLVDYLTVAVLETSALNNERQQISLMGERLAASVRLIAALGGGWSVSQLPDPGYPVNREKP